MSAGTNQPPWLKIMQNGSVGEARTKALLLDRFWVLERSVDIDGADFLIQPRDLSSRFTDRTPPKVGIVQAKYFQDRRTTHYIPQQYVLDRHGLPLKGFFSVLHVGEADDARMYMLSASEMLSNLDKTKDEPISFVLNGKALADKFRIDKYRRQALDRINHEISSRSTSESIYFLDRINIPYRKITNDDISYRYKMPIPNSQTDIPETYFEYRSELKHLLFNIEEALTIVDKILQEEDPRVALKYLEELEEYRGGSTWRDGLHFSTGSVDLDWPYLYDALDEHDARLKSLEQTGKLEAFVELSHKVRQSTVENAEVLIRDARPGQYINLRLDYDPASLSLIKLRLKLCDKKPRKTKSRFMTNSYIADLMPKKKQIDSALYNVWHDAMTHILFLLCPELKEDE